jgi:4-hydroxybenzoate polyprenyltransferase
LGLGLLVPLGRVAACAALLLVACIVLYDLRHKTIAWAPVLMGFCRLLLYPLAASAVGGTVSAHVMIAATALGAYVAGITYLARGESRPGKPARWALVLLVTPLALAMAFDFPRLTLLPLIGMLLFLSWMLWLLIPLLRRINPSIGRVVAGLLAGIVWVDVLAVAPLLGASTAGFLVLFGLALLLQRVIPAT